MVRGKEDYSQVYLSKPWVKFYDKGVPEEVEIPDKPLYSILLESSKDFPERTVIYFYGLRLKYKELLDYSKRFAWFLTERLGLSKGDVVSLLLPNTPQFAIAYYGALMAGCVVSPINPLYSKRELERCLGISKPRVMVALDVLHDRVEGCSGVDRVEQIVYTGIDDYLPKLLSLLYKLKERGRKPGSGLFKDGGRARWSDVMKASKPIRSPADINPKKDVAALMFTGGTTGAPKAAMLSHYNLLANVVQIDSWFKTGVKGRDVFMGVLPWFHIYGQTAVLNSGVYKAATIITFARLDLDKVLKAIDKHKVNIFHGVPTLYSMIINHPNASKLDLSSIEVCISGAAPLPKAVHEKFESLTRGKLREGYGLTETSPVTHVNPVEGKYKIGSIGLPVPSTLAGIVAIDGNEFLKPGEVGEIVVSGPQVMIGYTDEEENKRVFFEYGGRTWIRTGDLGYMDEEGYFYVVERKKDLIKYKGYSVYPRQVEEVLFKHECVADAAVVGVPHEELGEIVKAYVVLRDECKNKVSKDELIEYCKRELAPFEVPREIEFRDSLPKSVVGKTLRFKLREENAQNK